MVVDAQEPALLEVRLGDRQAGPGPRAPVLEEVDHRAPGVPTRAAPDRLLHEQLGREAERPNTALPSCRTAARPALERPHERAAQQHHLDEVVHVPGLERGVLAVVGEAQQLARLGLDPGIGTQAGDAAVATTVVAVERPVWLSVTSFPEVAGLAQVVGGAAAQAEHQRLGLEPPLERASIGIRLPARSGAANVLGQVAR